MYSWNVTIGIAPVVSSRVGLKYLPVERVSAMSLAAGSLEDVRTKTISVSEVNPDTQAEGRFTAPEDRVIHGYNVAFEGNLGETNVQRLHMSLGEPPFEPGGTDGIAADQVANLDDDRDWFVRLEQKVDVDDVNGNSLASAFNINEWYGADQGFLWAEDQALVVMAFTIAAATDALSNIIQIYWTEHV